MSDSDPPVRCAEVARALAEPLAGTGVKKARLWLCIEDRSSWEPKAFKALDAADQAAIAAFASRVEQTVDPRVRVQAIRRPRRDASAALRLIVADSEARRAWAFDLAHGYASLDAIDLSALASGHDPAGATPLDAPLYLVCMHTRRDACCALFGAPVYARLDELVDAEHVWQTSHVGGHRFAANVIVLPFGLCYGHIEPGETPELVAAADSARVFRAADRLRGLSLYPRAVQFADAWLRTRLDDDRLDAVRVVAWEKRKTPEGKHLEVLLEVEGGERHTVSVAEVEDPVARVVSCGERPERVAVFRVLE